MEKLTLDPIACVAGEINLPGSKSLSNHLHQGNGLVHLIVP